MAPPPAKKPKLTARQHTPHPASEDDGRGMQHLTMDHPRGHEHGNENGHGGPLPPTTRQTASHSHGIEEHAREREAPPQQGSLHVSAPLEHVPIDATSTPSSRTTTRSPTAPPPQQQPASPQSPLASLSKAVDGSVASRGTPNAIAVGVRGKGRSSRGHSSTSSEGVALTAQQQLDIIESVKSGTRSQIYFAHKYKRSRAYICKLVSDKNRLRVLQTMRNRGWNMDSSHLQLTALAEVERQLLDVVRENYANDNLPHTTAALQEHALKIARDLAKATDDPVARKKLEAFGASASWVTKFCRKHNVMRRQLLNEMVPGSSTTKRPPQQGARSKRGLPHRSSQQQGLDDRPANHEQPEALQHGQSSSGSQFPTQMLSVPTPKALPLETSETHAAQRTAATTPLSRGSTTTTTNNNNNEAHRQKLSGHSGIIPAVPAGVSGHEADAASYTKVGQPHGTPLVRRSEGKGALATPQPTFSPDHIDVQYHGALLANTARQLGWSDCAQQIESIISRMQSQIERLVAEKTAAIRNRAAPPHDNGTCGHVSSHKKKGHALEQHEQPHPAVRPPQMHSPQVHQHEHALATFHELDPHRAETCSRKARTLEQSMHHEAGEEAPHEQDVVPGPLSPSPSPSPSQPRQVPPQRSQAPQMVSVQTQARQLQHSQIPQQPLHPASSQSNTIVVTEDPHVLTHHGYVHDQHSHAHTADSQHQRGHPHDHTRNEQVRLNREHEGAVTSVSLPAVSEYHPHQQRPQGHPQHQHSHSQGGPPGQPAHKVYMQS